MSQDKVLDVRLNGLLLGRLEQNQVGKMVFRYEEDARRSLSLSMPVRPKPYENDACEALPSLFNLWFCRHSSFASAASCFPFSSLMV